MATLVDLLEDVIEEIEGRISDFVPSYQVEANAIFQNYGDVADQTSPLEETPSHPRVLAF